MNEYIEWIFVIFFIFVSFIIFLNYIEWTQDILMPFLSMHSINSNECTNFTFAGQRKIAISLFAFSSFLHGNNEFEYACILKKNSSYLLCNHHRRILGNSWFCPFTKIATIYFFLFYETLLSYANCLHSSVSNEQP